MSYRLYNSGNVLVFVDTAHTIKNGGTQFWIQKLPKNKTWYSYDNTAAPILYSVYFDNPERDLIIDAQYGQFQKEDGTVFTSDAELIAYLDKILGLVDNSGLAIAKGDVPGTTFIHKFGNAPDFDTGDNQVTIWDGANNGLLAGGALVYTYSATADIGLLSSSSGSDTVDIEIQGLLNDGTLSTQTFTLNGQTDVDLSATGTDFKRVFRMKNVGAANLVGTVYLRTNGSAQAGGVPSTANTVRAIVGIGNNQTLMSIYTIATGKTGYLQSFFASEGGASRDTNYIIKLFARQSGGVFQLKHKTALSTTGTSHFSHVYDVPEVFAAGTDIEMTTQITESPITAGDISSGFDLKLIDN